MNYADITSMIREIAPVIREYTAASLAPVVDRIDALARRLDDMPPPKDGKDADEDAITARLRGELSEDIKQLRGAVSHEIQTVYERLSAVAGELPEMIDQAVAAMPKPKDGNAAGEAAIAALVRDEIGKDMAEIRDALAGLQATARSAEPDTEAIVSQVMALIPKPKDGEPGQSVSVDDLLPHIEERVRAAVAELPVAKDGVGLAGALIDRDGELVITLSDGRQQKLGPVVGTSVDERVIVQRLCGEVADRIEELKVQVAEAKSQAEAVQVQDVAGIIADSIKALPSTMSRGDVAAMIEEAVQGLSTWDAATVDAEIARHVAKAFDQLPKPRDGASVTVDDVRPLIDEQVSKAVAELPQPRDGVDGRGLASMLIDRDGGLVATMTDGRTENLGRVVGRDGEDADMATIERRIAECVKALPQPKDGIDGVGFDDLDLEEADDGVFIKFARGERTKRYRLPVVVDRGVYRQGASYGKGNGVTWGGCFWIARVDTSDKPGATDAWRLAVKKGRDGKDAR